MNQAQQERMLVSMQRTRKTLDAHVNSKLGRATNKRQECDDCSCYGRDDHVHVSVVFKCENYLAILGTNPIATNHFFTTCCTLVEMIDDFHQNIAIDESIQTTKKITDKSILEMQHFHMDLHYLIRMNQSQCKKFELIM